MSPRVTTVTATFSFAATAEVSALQPETAGKKRHSEQTEINKSPSIIQETCPSLFGFVLFFYTVLTEKLKRGGLVPRDSRAAHYHDGVLAAVALNDVGIKAHL